MKGLSIKSDDNIEGIRKEYESLKWRATSEIDSSESLLWIVHSILTVIVIIIVAVKTHSIVSTFVAAVGYGYLPGLIASLIVSGILDAIVGERFERYLKNRRLTRTWYQRYLELGEQIADHDEAKKVRLEQERRHEAEAKRLRLLPLHNAIWEINVQLREYETLVRDLDYFFRRKKKWYSEYRPFEENIDQCVERLSDLVSESQRLEEKFEALARESPTSFPYLFNSIFLTQANFKSLLAKMQSMKNWTPPIRTATPKSTVREPTTPPSQPPRMSASRSTIVESERSEKEYDFSLPNNIKQPIVVMPPAPPKRRILNRQLKKIPFQDYVGAAQAKMTIGELGEVVVLHYEVRRVQEESGRFGTHRVRRVSEESDSFGYDIESFSQGEKVYIEVKSTSGPFWTDFFLTANERNVMKELGEKYWLYRIFELSKEDGSAKLSVFRGKSEIDLSFEMEAANFKITPKGMVTADDSFQFTSLE